MHGPHRLPGRGVRSAVGGRPDLHDGGGGRQRNGGAERRLLDDRSSVASVRLAGHELSGRRHRLEPRRRRLRPRDLVRQDLHLRGLRRRR